MTETWGRLTVGNVISGTVEPSRITGTGVAPDTGIISNLTGSGAGSTWVVNNAQSISDVKLTQTGFLSQVTNNPSSGIPPAGGVTTLWIEPNNKKTLEINTKFGGFPSGSSAGPLALTHATGAKHGYATLVKTGASLSRALSDYRLSNNNQSFTAVQWIGDTPAQLTASQTSTWCAENSVTYLPPMIFGASTKPSNRPDRGQNCLPDKFHASFHASSHAGDHATIPSCPSPGWARARFIDVAAPLVAEAPSKRRSSLGKGWTPCNCQNALRTTRSAPRCQDENQ
jgi:hypothetical protein